MPIPVDGPGAAAFLSLIFKEDTSQRPDFDLGPAALRRVELEKMAAMIGETFREGSSKNDKVSAVREWMISGRFDHLHRERAGTSAALPEGVTERIADVEKENSDLRAEVQAMKDMFRDFVQAGNSAEAMRRLQDFLSGEEGLAGEEVAADPILSSDTSQFDAIRTVEEIEALSIRDLRAYARHIGLNATGLKRDMILVAIREKLMLGDDGEDATDVEDAA